jgi:CheY-like chemotaxis protein
MTAEAPSLIGLRVLLVEDEMIVSLLIEDMLQDLSCVIVGPYDRFDPALAAAKADPFDFALLDINIAGVKAYPVAEVLTSRGIPFLFLSGYGEAAVPSDHPSWRVCSKPFRSDQLVTMMREQLRAQR